MFTIKDKIFPLLANSSQLHFIS